jgi:hypothetical protein
MSEEQIAEAFDLNNEEASQEPENKEPESNAPAEFNRDDWEASFTDRAEKQGWTDYAPYVDRGGDPANWRPAREFVERGEMIGELKTLRQSQASQEKSFDERLVNNNKLHEQQTALFINELEIKRDQAIERGDKDEAVGYMDNISELKTEPAPKPEASPDMAKAEKLDSLIRDGNEWIYGQDDKGDYAASLLRDYWQKGHSPEEIVTMISNKVDKVFPSTNVNHNRNIPAATNNSKGPGGKAQARSLTMNDLSSDERKLWNGGHNPLFTDEKKFLQSVQDSRRT